MKVTVPITDIIIQSPKKFKKSIDGLQQVSPFPNYRIKDAVLSDTDKYTMNANTCSILGMSNGKNTFLGHFATEQKSTNFKDKLDYIVKKFQDETGRLSTIITGAFDCNMYTPIPKQAKESFKQMTEIGEILDKNNAVLSMIGGKRSPLFMDNLAITDDKFIISHTPKKFGFEPMEEYNNNSNLEIFLTSKYSVVEIAPEHNIEFIK